MTIIGIMIYKRINITLPEDLLSKLDNTIEIQYITRSAYIREAITLKHRLDSAILAEVKDKDSMLNIVHSMHVQKMAVQDLRKMGSLTYQQAQD